MSDKSVWQGIGNLVGGWGKAPAKPLATSTRRCEAGHPMAMDWVKCPYCEAARNAGERTRINEADVGPGHAAVPSRQAAGATRINTQSGDDGDADDQDRDDHDRDGHDRDDFTGSEQRERMASKHRETRIDPGTDFRRDDQGDARAAGSSHDAGAAAGGGAARGATKVLDAIAPGAPKAQRHGGGRRLTGIVVTFSWSPLGQLFEVHEGRNFGGSGAISAEGQRDADILVTEDGTMSSSHFLILCQGGKYAISDCNSTNGTFVDGEQIDRNGIELVDGALIQAGATLLTFKKILAPSAAKTERVQKPLEEPPEVIQPRHRKADEDPLR